MKPSSNDIAISARGLSKDYTIAHQSVKHSTLAESLLDRVRHPFRRETRETFNALKDVSFEIKKGEAVGIIGRNGAGKSTLLKVLSRITEPTSGEIDLYGRVGSLLEVGTGFHPELSGRENIFLNGAILGMSRGDITKQFDAIVDFAGVEKFLDTPVKRYSSGMYVRLAFAVAAHLSSDILIVDEVLAVGDVQFQKKCLGKMHDVSHSDGRTVLFVSHNMSAVRQLTQTGILLDAGRVVFQGDSKTAVEKYEGLGLDQSSGVYDATALRRPNYEMTGDVRFVTLQFDPQRYQTFAADEDIAFSIRLKATRPAPRFRLSLTLFRSDGVSVASVFGPDSLSLSSDEERDFVITIPNPRLAPGRYHIGTSVGTGNHTTGHRDYDILMDVLHFEVTAPEGENGTQAVWPASWGAIRLPELLCA
jgi:lipopolysaccharide transport system ATP-binding protein